MNYLFVEYPKCSTCQKAKKWLEENGVSYTQRHIVENNPTAAELKEWVKRSGLPLRRFFNTSGMLYREMGLKDKLPEMTEDEQIALLATNGMLVKRPLLIGEHLVLTGFREADWQQAKDEVVTKKCNCRWKNCVRHGECDACIEHHNKSEKYPQPFCKRKK